MTEKRFTLSEEYESCYGYFDDGEELGGYDVLDLLNNYDKENEELKQFKKEVFDLINKKIDEYQEYDGYDTEKYYIGTQLLKELKKELGDDVE